jgi:hypothetical protein
MGVGVRAEGAKVTGVVVDGEERMGGKGRGWGKLRCSV